MLLAAPLTLLAGLVCLVWFSRHVMIWRERRSGFLLGPAYAGPPPSAPKITVIVAAKDEEANIAECVQTMLAQDYPNFEMIVSNDRSGDSTAQIVSGLAAADSRLRLINIEQLPEGWCGKNNAMQTAIASCRSEWICMIDADCRQESPRTLSVSMQYALDRGADLLSVLPRLDMRGFWENVVQPVCSGVMMIWFQPDRVNNPAKPNAYANGAFMLMRRSAYEAIGTHEAVKDRINEDMHMAARIKQAGLRLTVVRGGGLYSVRMYTSFRAILKGWSRIFLGTFGTVRRLAASLAVLVVMGLLPYIAAPIGLAMWQAGAWWKALAAAGLAGAALQLSVIYRFYKLIYAEKRLAWTYPLGCLVAIAAVCISLSKLRRGAKVTWRGTSYAGAVPEAQRQQAPQECVASKD